MRSFGIVERKLEEADFFCEKLHAASVSDIHFYFSAFIAASRSVTFALQASLKGLDGFDDWYGGWQDQLKADPLARFFHRCRTDSQHLGLCPIQGGFSGPGGSIKFLFGPIDPQGTSWVPEDDVATCARLYLARLCELVNDCFRNFGLIIDPNQIYTRAGMGALGLTCEDLEEHIGLPRGWTALPGSEELPSDARLKILRRNIPMSYIGLVLEKYIGPENVFSRPPE